MASLKIRLHAGSFFILIISKGTLDHTCPLAYNSSVSQASTVKEWNASLSEDIMKKKEISADFTFDYCVIGSGFGGSVSAMRLSQKGYSVGMVEAGLHWQSSQFPRSNWNLRKFLWMPLLRLYGTWRLRVLRDVFILAGAGVGGGSLNYANTLYTPLDVFFTRDSVKRLGGKKGLTPFYKLASKMLGVTTNPVETEQDILMRETAKEIGRGDTFRFTPVGVYFGKKGEPARDPYFYGEGPDRVGCELCGECMTGCRRDAKNTLDKNYLYFAQKFGTRIFAENQVTEILPLSEDGSEGYIIKTRKTTGFFRRFRGITIKSRGVVLSAGTLGTNTLLLDMKRKKKLPNLSPHLGRYVRTNSETIMGVRSLSRKSDFTQGVAITSSVHPDDDTHIEPVRFGTGHGAMSPFVAALTDGGGILPRFIRWIFNELRRPLKNMMLRMPWRWAEEMIVLLVMQPLDNYLNLRLSRPWFFPFMRSLRSSYGTDKKNPTWIKPGNDFGKLLEKRTKGVAGNVITEVMFNAPMTAHIMGGCTVGPVEEEGVIDLQNRVKGYTNLLVCDGSQIPENPGVNPSLTITALTERAMSFIPVKKGKKLRYLTAEKKWKLDTLLTS